MQRRQFGALGISAAVLSLSGHDLPAQTYPDRPIRMIVPYAPGGGTDAVTRIVMRKMSESMGQAIIVENKGGVGGSLAFAEAAHARPDGYTLTVGGAGLALLSLIFDKLSFDPATDLVSVAPMAGVPIALVASNTSGLQTMGELIASAKSHPSTPLAYGTPGVATPPHLAGVLLASTAGITLTSVPYRGTAPAIQDVAGGQIPLAIVGLSTALAFSHAGRVKILGVGSAKRSPLAPDIPTLAEGGVKGYEATYWYDVTVARGTPQPVIDRLRVEIAKAVQSADVHEALLKAGFEPMVMSAAENERALDDAAAKWGKVIRDNHIRASE